jgi:cytochrome c oxidase assembly protein subunit 15
MSRVLAWLPDSVDHRVRAMAWASLVVQIGIVATGGAVRLTGSGLGCPTWPRCTPETFIVMPAQGIHGAIEFGNRLLTFVLAAVAVAAVLSVLNLRHARPDLWRLAIVLAAGIPAQAGLGGLTVLTGLNPWLVGAHFIVSAVLVCVAAAFVVATRATATHKANPVQSWLVWLGYAAAIAAAVAVALGVVTTGAGPHAGDAATPRNGLDLETLEHLHSYPAYLMLGVTIALAAAAKRVGLERIRPMAYGLVAVEIAQITLGVVQARYGVPALLVGVHMVLACVLLATMTALILRLRESRV